MSEAFLQTVEKALKVLETIVASSESELGVKDITERLNLPRSTAHRILSTLEKLDYVVQNEQTGKYRPGVKTVHIGANILMKMNIVKECRPYLKELSRLTGETSHLSIYNRGFITFVDKVSGNNPSKITSLIGQNRAAYTSASGKVLLAFLPREHQQRFFEKTQLEPVTPYTITDKNELHRHLSKIREQSFGEDLQEAEEGLVCYAAPVYGVNGEVVAAISVSGSPSRLISNKEHLVNILKDMAEKASVACGWNKDFKWK